MPLLLVAILLGLLGVLAALQYSWLGQISDAERNRLRTRLSEDTVRFADEFNREVQLAYFNFQATSETFNLGENKDIAKRYLYWTANTKYPTLIEGLYYYTAKNPDELISYDTETASFRRAEWSPRLKRIRTEIGDGKRLRPVIGDETALAVPVYEDKGEVQHIIVRTKKLVQKSETESSETSEVPLPEKYGYLVVLLDRRTITGKMLPDLVSSYFSDSDSANYELVVQDEDGKTVFSKGDGTVTKPDAEIPLFNIKPNSFSFFGLRSPEQDVADKKKKSAVVLTEKYETATVRSEKPAAGQENATVDVNIVTDGKPNFTVFEAKGGPPAGAWKLRVQHVDGSLDQFVANTRRRNLAVSFGILSLLAVSIILIFVSSQRARRLARNQLEFVSSVSHEFRTPLAVIYSAGENLSDGVVDDKRQVADYGELIKKEGRKLSGMVEQVLEFAGARSGRRRFEMRKVSAADIVEKALADLRPGIDESGFEVETDINRNVPDVEGDEQALVQAVENLVSNALKYSNGSRWLRVYVRNGGNSVKIGVEDRGIGIPLKEQKRIFEPFYRSRLAVDEQISGNGLGLSLVKQIIDAHRGEISVESEPGKGSRFEIRLSAINGQ